MVASKLKKDCQYKLTIFLAAEEGLEPSQTESESAVLPLHNSAFFIILSVCCVRYSNTDLLYCQVLFRIYSLFFAIRATISRAL